MAKSFNSMMEDVYTSEFKVKTWVDPVTGKTKTRKIRPHRVEFEASKLRGEPDQKDAEGDYGMKESFKGTPSVRTNHYSWGTMKTIHSGSDFNIPLHPEHHQAIAKLEDEQEHHFKTEDGKSWTARRKGTDVHFQGANGGNSAVVSHASMRETTEQDLANELNEVLSADATAGDWIHDFVHSTNPRFAGKSKKERIKMALGAYYGKKIKEEVESLEENVYDGEEQANRIKKALVAKHKDNNYSVRVNQKGQHVIDHAYYGTKKVKSQIKNLSEEKDPHEYADGEMSIHELKQIKAHVEWILEMLKPETDMPEWVQAKITLAADYLSTACDYLHVELNEELKGGQKKLDKNHNGKLDSQDFQILRHMKKRKQVEEALTAKTTPPKANATGVNASPKSTETKSTTTSEPPFDKPYTTNTGGTVTDKSGAKHTPMSRARDLARTALKKMQEEKKAYAGLEKEPKKGLPTALVKTSKNAVNVDTVEGWDDPHKAVKESVQKVDVPAYLRKAKGEKPLELKDLKRKDTLSDAENLKAARGVKEGVSFADFKMMLEARTQYVVKLSHPDSGHTMLKNYTADKGEDDYDIKRRAQVEHGGKGYSVDSVRKKDIDAYDSEDDENAEKSSTTKRGRGRPAGAKSGARGPRIK